MSENNDPRVNIRRQWNSWRTGVVRLNQLSSLHWDDTSGGVSARAPHYFIHGYTWCTDVEGEIDHSCQHGPPPHRIKVCVVRIDNDSQVFDQLLAIIGPKPERYLANPQLREARRRAGLTQKALAEAVGLKPRTVSQWETRGTVPRSVAVRKRVAEMVGYEW